MAASLLFIWLLGLVSLTVLFVLGHLHPIAYLATGTWLPLPILLIGWRLGERAAVSLALVAAILILSAKPTVSGLLDNLGFMELLLMGLVLNSLRTRGYHAAHTIILTVVALAGIMVLFLAGQSLFTGQAPLELLKQKASETAATMNKILSEAGVETQDLMPMGIPKLDWETTLLRILPALVIINTAFVAWFNMVVARWLAHLWEWDEPGLPLSEWSNPEWLIFVLVAAGFFFLIPLDLSRLVSLNLLLVVGFLYFCQGVAVVATMFQRFYIPWFVRLVCYPLLFMNPLFFLVIILGLTDLWLDFRRLHQPRDA